MNDHRRTARGGIWLFAQLMADRAVTALIVFYLAHKLGPTEFGLAALTIISPGLAGPALRAVIDGIVHRPDEEGGFYSSALVFAVAAALFFIVLGVALGGFFSWYFDRPDLFWQSILASLTSLFIAAGATPEAIMVKQFRFRPLAIRRIAAAAVGAAASIYMVHRGYGGWSVGVFFLVSQALAAVTSFALVGWLPRDGATRRDLAYFRGYCGPLIAANLVPLLTARGLEVLLALVVGPAAAAAVRIALQIVETAIGVIFTASDSMILLVLSRLRTEPDALADAFRYVNAILMILIVLIFPFLNVALPPLITEILGPEWAYAGKIASIFALLAFPYSIDFTARSFLKAARRTDQILLIVAIYGACSIGATLLLALIDKALTPYGYLIGAILSSVSALTIMRRSIPVKIAPLALDYLIFILIASSAIALGDLIGKSVVQEYGHAILGVIGALATFAICMIGIAVLKTSVVLDIWNAIGLRRQRPSGL